MDQLRALPGVTAGSASNVTPVCQLELTGRSLASAASVTWGMVRTRSRSPVKSAWRWSSLGYACAGSDTIPTNTFRGSTPRSTEVSFWKLRIRRPAPTSSTSASATSATIRVLRIRSEWRPLVAPRPPSRSAPTRLPPADCIAGTRPKAMPVTSERSSANASTDASSRISTRRGMLPGWSASRTRTPLHASATPRAPPISESSTLSVRSWPTMRSRRAPIATRSASSRCRPAARPSSRFATWSSTRSGASPRT